MHHTIRLERHLVGGELLGNIIELSCLFGSLVGPPDREVQA
jgi:hypothetical protein